MTTALRTIPKSCEALPTELAEQAARLLGYQPLQNHLKLKATLDELGILAFTPQSVKNYQERIIFKALAPRAVATIGLIIGLPIILAIGTVWYTFFSGYPMVFRLLAGGLLSALILLDEVRSTFLDYLENFGQNLLGDNYEWRSIPLTGYQKAMPYHVLEKAVAIKLQLPEASLFIEELETIPDPFLIVQLGSESYHIDVWDEPKFEEFGKTEIPLATHS